jgi:hypothetical protein
LAPSTFGALAGYFDEGDAPAGAGFAATAGAWPGLGFEPWKAGVTGFVFGPAAATGMGLPALGLTSTACARACEVPLLEVDGTGAEGRNAIETTFQLPGVAGVEPKQQISKAEKQQRKHCSSKW